MERVILHANDGMVLTNGESYGKEIYLADGMNADSFYEITDKEYEERIMLPEMMDSADLAAENKDMKNALKILGVE